MTTSRVLGYAPTATIDSDGGKVRVTYAAFECDWKIAKDCPVDSSWYVYNVTRSAVSAITAKAQVSGTTWREGDESGFRFTTALDSAGASWQTGDRCWVIQESTLRAYATPALMLAAVGNGDKVTTGYNDSAGKTSSWLSGSAGLINSKTFSWRGMLSRQRVRIVIGYSYGYFFYGDLSGVSGQDVIENMTFLGQGYSSGYVVCFTWRQDSGAAGAGLKFDRLVFQGQGSGANSSTISLAANGASNFTISRSIFLDGNRAIGQSGNGSALNVIHCTQVGDLVTSSQVVPGAGVTTAVKNCLFDMAVAAPTGSGIGANSVSYSATRAATMTGDNGTCLLSQTDAQLALWGTRDNHYCVPSGRITTASVGHNAGSYDASYPEDIDGNPLSAGNTPMGAHAGTKYPYGVDWHANSEIDPLATPVQQFGALSAPSMDVPALASVLSTDTLRGVPGTCDKIYSAAEEIARNTDPGAGNVVREADGGPASYLIRGSSKTPSFNLAAAEAAFESGRNEVPDLSKIPTEATGGPAAWLQLNVSRSGTLDLDAVKQASYDDGVEAGYANGYAAAEAAYPEVEAGRNTVPDLTKIPSPATGGPVAWLQLGASRQGTLDLDAVKAASYDDGVEAGYANGYAAAEAAYPEVEAERNKIPDLTKIPSPATGGPSAWLQLGVSRQGSLNLDAIKQASYEDGVEAGYDDGVEAGYANGYAAAQALFPDWESLRNDNIPVNKVQILYPYKNLGQNKVGELSGSGIAETKVSETRTVAGEIG